MYTSPVISFAHALTITDKLKVDYEFPDGFNYLPMEIRYYDVEACKWSEWEHFEPFYEWAKQSGYQEGLTIERKDVNKNYSPENCCWIPLSRQVSNTRRTVWIEHNGEIHNIKARTRAGSTKRR